MNRKRNAILAGILSATFMGGYLIAQQAQVGTGAQTVKSDPLLAPQGTLPALPAQSGGSAGFAPAAPATISSQGGLGGSWGGGGFGSTGNFPRSSPLGQAMDKLNQAKAAVKKANTDEEKKKADEQLVKALNDYFEQDMVQRKAELAAVKKRLEDLEKQLQKRESSKGDIVDLQKKVIVNELNGLGFYGSNAPTSSGVFSSSNPLDTYRRYEVPVMVTPPAPPAPAGVPIPLGRTANADPATPTRAPSSESPKTTPVPPAVQKP